MDRVCIFIDGSNLYFQLKELDAKVKIDYHRLSLALAGEERKLVRTYYYTCPPPDPQVNSYDDQHKFFSYLKNTPYLELRFGRLEVRGDAQVEKGVDVRIAVDMVSMAYADAYDAAVLISNDADLAPALNKIKDLGKQVEYVYFSRKTVQLIESCDLAVQVNREIFQKCKA